MSKSKTEIRDLLQYRFPENLQYSPDGKRIAFQTARCDEKKNAYHRDVWLIQDGKAEQLTQTLNTSLICWDDAEHLLLMRKAPDQESEDVTIYRMNVKGGEAAEWLKLPFAPSGMKKVEEGMYVFAAGIRKDDPDAYLESEEERKKKQEEFKKEADYQVVDEVPYWANGQGFTNGERNALFLLETIEGRKLKRITPALFNTDSFVTEEGKIYFTGNVLNRRQSLYNKVYVYDVHTKKKETLYGKNTYSFQDLFVLDHVLYGLASDMKTYGINETGKFVRIEKDNVTFVKDPERSLYCSIAGDTMIGGGKSSAIYENNLYTLAANDDHIEIWKFDGQFNKTVLYDKAGAVFFLDVSERGIIFARESADSLGEIYEMDREGKNIHRLTALNEEVLKDKYIALPKRIDYVSEGESLHGWVLVPENFSPKKKYPAILDIHGGPRAIYGEVYFHEMQVWAAKGYVVFFTNIRGSDGRGDAFADIRDQYGEVDYRNLMDFTDAVTSAYPNIDPEKICVTGGSYGGFMTNWIITHTNRFAAAASQRSIANWVSMTFISDIGLYFCADQCGAEGLFGDVNTEKLWNHSPLKYAASCKTPTLFIHSDEDYRCPLPEGMQMMQALAVQNVETRMCIFHGENHELSRSGKPLHRIRRLEEITNWFEAHTKGK